MDGGWMMDGWMWMAASREEAGARDEREGGTDLLAGGEEDAAVGARILPQHLLLEAHQPVLHGTDAVSCRWRVSQCVREEKEKEERKRARERRGDRPTQLPPTHPSTHPPIPAHTH
jgi:hypothetical protein